MSITLRRRSATPLALMAITGMVLVGCANVRTGGNGPEDAGKADGVVTIYGSITGDDAELLEQSWADWEEENGIQIRYEGSKEFATQIGIRAQGDKLPDLAIFPQPTLFKDMVERDLIQQPPVNVKLNMTRYWSQDWVNYSSKNGVIYGAPLLAEVKNFIWYSPAQFAARGWSAPATWQGLRNLTETMYVELNGPPWCPVFEAGSRTDHAAGAAGAAWIESIVLGLHGPDTYDRWVSNEVKFSDQAIKDSFKSVGEILLNRKYVKAGIEDETPMISTTTEDLARALVTGTCSLTQQGPSFESLITDPEIGNSTVGPSGAIWVFLTPSDTTGAHSVIGSGGIVGAFSNDADTIKVQEYLSSPEWANSRVKLGGAISANNGVDPANASNPIAQLSIRLLQDPRTTFRFDASELMPTPVGQKSFPTEVLAWLDGGALNKTLATIDDSWPVEE